VSFGHPLIGNVRRPFELILEEDDPRVPILTNSRSWNSESVILPDEQEPAEEPAPETKPEDEQSEAEGEEPEVEDAPTPLAALGEWAEKGGEAGVSSVEEIVEMGEEGLQHIHGIGEATAKKIMVAANKAIEAKK